MARAVTSCRRQDHGLGVGRHLVLAVVPEGDLDPLGLRLDRVDLADRHSEDADVVAGEDAVAVLEVGDDIGAVALIGVRSSTTTTTGDDHRPARRPGSARRSRAHWPASAAWTWRRPRRAPARTSARGRSGVDCRSAAPARAVRAADRRAAARAAARGRDSSRWDRAAASPAPHPIAGVAGDRVGQGQMRFAALAGPRDRAPAAPGSRAGRSAGRCARDGSSTLGSSPRSENAASTNGCTNWPGSRLAT